MTDFKKKPPTLPPEVEAFIKSAAYAQPEELMPWEAPGIREDVFKVFNFRIREKYYIKLDYLAKKKEISKNKLCLDALIAVLEQELGK